MVVNALDLDRDWLDLFDKLVAPSAESDRVAAVGELVDAAAGPAASGGGGGGEGMLEYASRRLVRGMASGRGSARQGFGLALCELLKATEGRLTTEDVNALVAKSLALTGEGRPKRGEVKDVLLGRVFVYGALALARRLRSPEDCAAAVSDLLAMSSKKDYLCEACFAVIREALDTLSDAAFSNVKARCPELVAILAFSFKDGDAAPRNGAAGSPPDPTLPNPPLGDGMDEDEDEEAECRCEEFQLALWIWKRFGQQSCARRSGFAFLLGNTYDPDLVFDRPFLVRIRRSLLRSTISHPRVHSLWDDLLAALDDNDAAHASEEGEQGTNEGKRGGKSRGGKRGAQ